MQYYHPYRFMGNTASIVSGIENKLRKLMERHRELQFRIEKYRIEIQELKQIHEVHIKTIKDLEEKNKITTLTRTVETKEGTAEAKARINELVREIDKCIGLLNR